jgi:SNF2 family DNA or RNA helicase
MDASGLVIPHLKTPLYPHQIQMVNAMKQHALRMTQGFVYDQELVRGKLGIVADPNGTGKTLSVLSYIAIQDRPGYGYESEDLY